MESLLRYPSQIPNMRAQKRQKKGSELVIFWDAHIGAGQKKKSGHGFSEGIYRPFEGPGFLPIWEVGRPWRAPSCWYRPSRSIWLIPPVMPFCMASWFISIPCLAIASCCSWTLRLVITFCTYIINCGWERKKVIKSDLNKMTQEPCRMMNSNLERKQK